MNTTSFGHKVGASIGKTAAYAGHGLVVAAQSTGRFGADIVSGTQQGYTEKAQELAARRAAYVASHPQTKVAITKRAAKVAA